MPDPFSAAASAAGIASLGIQVCKGLALYLRSVEGRKQQIAHDLREVQRLISMFYSLNDILPHINRRGPADSAIIRQCLKDSEQKLQEFQQLLIKRRGPENPTGIPGKMKEAGRLLMYPFCEGRLISLRQTLQTLLDNLNSTIHIASLDLAIAHNDEIHSVKTSIGGLVASSQVQTDEVRDLQTQMHDNFDQLRLVQSTVTDSLNNIEQRLARTQWSIQDVGQNASGRLTMIQTDTQSIASTSLMTSERITEVMEKADCHFKLNQMHPILNQIKEATGNHHMISQSSFDVTGIAISPIARAILLQSLGDLEAEILRDPKAPMETFYGCTTLQLCAVWPQGLQKLLETEAKNLIEGCGKQHICSEAICYCYDVPFTYAIRWQCAESVDLLMKAGCSMSSDASTFYGLSSTTNECAAVIASNLAERRQTLLELAHQEFADLQHQDPPHVADTAAAHLCKVLKNAGIAIPRSLEVGRDYTTIYHCPGIPIHHFQIYFEQGFVDFKLHNNIGLTPIMVWRETFDVVNHCRSDQVFEAFLWLHKQGFLDQTPEDPLAIGLNIHATGWHYVGAMLGATCEEWLQDSDFETPLAWKVIRILSQTTMRDHCACWCNPKGEGCSPLKSLWNAHTDHRGMMLYHSQTQRAISFSHILFHHDLNVTGIEDDKPSNLSLQLIRLLTFEALDMTHTCCSLERLNLQEKRLCVASDYGNHGFYDCKTALVIANRDPELLQRIRSNIRERENAHQLGFLMKEFTAQLKRLDPSPKALEIFIWGHWRRRMSELFIVQSEILEETEQILGNVRTYVVPERLQFFLGEDFDWLRPEAQATPEQEESEEDDDASSVENVGVSRYSKEKDADSGDAKDKDSTEDSSNE
ncbi:Nn.00g043410.m01.CDS01 [Neocucurbitaria sp. VM-36]